MASPEPLAEGERLVLRLHPHGRTMLRPIAILLLIAAITIVVMVVLPTHTANLAAIRIGIGAAALVAALYWFGAPFLRWRTTTYELTSRRLRMREGIITRTGRDFPLSRISDVSFSQSVLDRLLGCGKLIVESPGEQGQLVLTEIPGVQRVQAILFDLVGNEAARTEWPGRQPSA